MNDYSTKIRDFYEYVLEFYEKETGIYPIATEARIVKAVNQYLESKPLSEVQFDSFDREAIKEILERQESNL